MAAVLSATSAFAQSDCASAVTTAADTTVLVDTSATANNVDSSVCGGGTRGNDYWIQFTGLTDGFDYVVESSDDGDGSLIDDTVIEIFEGTTCGTAVSIACNADISGGNFYSRVSFTAQAGMTYWAFNETEFANGNGTWNVTIDAGSPPPMVPANDTCATATAIASLPFADTTTNTTLATDTIDNSAAVGFGGGLGRDVWYTYTPAADETIRVTISNANFDAGGGIFSGADCMNLTELDATDNFLQGGADEVLTLAVTTGTQYWILVEGFDATEAGVIGLTVSTVSAVTNDDCASATVIASLPFADMTTDTSLATDTLDNSASVVGGGLDVYYAYTPATSGTYEIRSANGTNGNFNASVGIYTGACGSLTELASQDDFSFDDEAMLVDLVALTPYIILLEGRSAADAGVVNFSVSGPITGTPGNNDSCADALSIAADGTPVAIDTTGNANGAGSSCNASASNARGADFWLNATGLTIGSTYQFATADGGSGTLANSLVSVFEGACGSLTEVACTTFDGTFVTATFVATATDHTFLVQAGFLDAAGDMSVTLNELVLAAGDTCDMALTLAAGTTETADTSASADLQGVTCGFGGDPGGNDVWYMLTGLTPGNVYTIDTNMGGASPITDDTTIELWSGADCASAVMLQCNDDRDPGNSDFYSQIIFSASTDSYWVFATGIGTAPINGTFDISLDAGVVPGPGETCANPLGPLTAGGASLTVDTTGGVSLVDAPCGGDTSTPEVWIDLGTLAAGTYSVFSSADSMGGATPATDTVLAVFANCGATAIACNDQNGVDSFSDVAFTADGTSQYTVLAETFLDSFFGGEASGSFDVALVQILPPANDACPGTNIDPTMLPFNEVVDTRGAGDEGFDTTITTDIGAPDVYYTFTPMVDGTYTIDALGYDTVVGVYADACGSLGATPVIEVNDSTGGEGTSAVLTMGTAYTIVVEGNELTDSGMLDFTLDLVVFGPGDECDQALAGPAAGNAITVDTTGRPDLVDSDCQANTGPEAWYTLSGLNIGSDYVLSTEADSSGGAAPFTDTVLELFTGTCGSLALVECDDDDGPGLFSEIQFTATATDYILTAQGFGTNEGQFDLRLTELVPPANDTCAAAIDVTPLPFSSTVDTRAAGDEGFDTSVTTDIGAIDVYYTFTPAAGDYVIAADGFDTVVGVYADACGALGTTVIAEVNNNAAGESFTATLAMGTTYIIVVEGNELADTGILDFSVTQIVLGAGDSCDMPLTGPAVGATITADTTGHFDMVDASCALANPAEDVWYTLGVLPAGDYHLFTADDTVGATPNGDPVLAVFNGPCAGLTEIACDDDAGPNFHSDVTFTADGTSEVFVMAETYGAPGSFLMTLEGVVPTEITKPGFAWVQNVDFANFDATDGDVVTIGSLAASNYIGGDFMGSDPSTFFAHNAADTTLDSIDTATGAITAGPTMTGFTAPFTLPINLAWDPSTSTFYMGVADGATFSGGAIGTVDPVTGAYTEIATYGSTQSVQSIAVDASGQLYLLTYDVADGAGALTLHTVNKADGSITATLGATGIGTGQFSEMDFNEGDGQLYLQVLEARGDIGNPGPNELYTLSTANGAATLVAPVSGDVTFFALGFVGQAAGVDNWSDY